jgi:hypothetical protein
LRSGPALPQSARRLPDTTSGDSDKGDLSMRSFSRLGALVLTAVALLAFAAAADAKGGGKGGGGGKDGGGAACGTIDSFDVSAGYVNGQPSITWSAQTTNLCIDERAGSTAIDSTNESTGFVGRSVTFGRGTQTFGSTLTSAPGVKYTFTVTVYQPNGKIAATQTKSVTAPPAL